MSSRNTLVATGSTRNVPGSYDNWLPIHSSMYRDLRTNLPKEVMMFPDFRFDPQLPSFLPHQEVQRYLERYCQSLCITPHIRMQFALAVLEGSVALPLRAEMEEAHREMKRKVQRGVQLKHMLKMDKDQWGYAQTLAQTGRFSRLPPVTQSLYEEVWRQRHIHPQNYRQLNYQINSDTQWEQQKLQFGE